MWPGKWWLTESCPWHLLRTETMASEAIARLAAPVRRLLTTLLHEGLAPGRAAAAVFTGVFIGHVPIYGLQSVAAIGLAVLFRLNKPLTFAATFVNNPLFQPFMVAGSLEVGHLILTGKPWRVAFPQITITALRADVAAWLVGSIVLGTIAGGIAASSVFLLLRWKARAAHGFVERRRLVNRLFANAPWLDRGFVRWKLRLDRVFDYLQAEDLGTGCAVDLGCGYGIALGFAALGNPGRHLVGCDLNRRRIAAARQAFEGMNAEFVVGDVRRFDLPYAGLVFIMDVLQYLAADDQLALLARSCAALEPGGKLIFRVHDREHGLLSRLTHAFDRLIFLADRTGLRPLTLPVEQYRQALERAGMLIIERGSKPAPAGAYSLRCDQIAGRGGMRMITRIVGLAARLVVRKPVLVVLTAVVLTLVLYSHIHDLRLGTDLTDMFGNKDPEWRIVSQVGRELGYGNQLFVLVEAPPGPKTRRNPWKMRPSVSCRK